MGERSGRESSGQLLDAPIFLMKTNSNPQGDFRGFFLLLLACFLHVFHLF